MAELHVAEKIQERAIVAGLSGVYKNSDEAQASLDELGELVEAAGGVCVRSVMQMRQTPEAATFLGKGKLDEIVALAELHECNLLVVDTELKGSQLRNVAEYTGLKVLDRSLLILDIFAKRAVSAEGKLQVELAQLQQRLSRLTGMGQVLSRLGGGIGTRGPGESQLESDRRHIRRRIEHLQAELALVEKRRLSVRKRRSQDGAKVVCVVGYTNAGKSSLLNRLCDAGLWEMDQVFATLDPAARRLVLENGGEIVVIDTVGFIRRLPTALIEAFKSTLEVVLSADLLLHVSDVADPYAREKEAVVLGILDELGAAKIPSMHLLNKVDLLRDAGFVGSGVDSAAGVGVVRPSASGLDLGLVRPSASGLDLGLVRPSASGLDTDAGVTAGVGVDAGVGLSSGLGLGSIGSGSGFVGANFGAGAAISEISEDNVIASESFSVPLYLTNNREAAQYLKVLPLSLKTGEGLSEVREALQQWYEEQDERFEILFPYSEAKLVAQIYRDGRVLERRDEEGGVFLSFTLPADYSAGLRTFLARRDQA